MLTAALILAALVGFVAWALCRVAARNTTFDTHVTTALALLQPDNQALPDEPSDAELSAAVDALLADLFPTIRPAIPEES